MNIHLFGLDSGSKVEYLIKRLIKGKGFDENITLKELFEKTKKRLIITSVCVNTMELCYLTHDTEPDLPLYVALKMSTAIPFIYCPIEYKNNLYIDGGCFDNYPISYFKNEIDKTLGIILFDSKSIMDKINDLESYILRVLQCMIEGMTYNAKHGYENSTVDIHLDSVNIINFDIDDDKKDELFLKGYDAIKNKLKNNLCSPNTPLIESSPSIPLVESSPNTPLVESSPNIPLVESSPSIPLIKSGPSESTPLHNSENVISNIISDIVS